MQKWVLFQKHINNKPFLSISFDKKLTVVLFKPESQHTRTCTGFCLSLCTVPLFIVSTRPVWFHHTASSVIKQHQKALFSSSPGNGECHGCKSTKYWDNKTGKEHSDHWISLNANDKSGRATESNWEKHFIKKSGW